MSRDTKIAGAVFAGIPMAMLSACAGGAGSGAGAEAVPGGGVYTVAQPAMTTARKRGSRMSCLLS